MMEGGHPGRKQDSVKAERAEKKEKNAHITGFSSPPTSIRAESQGRRRLASPRNTGWK